MDNPDTLIKDKNLLISYIARKHYIGETLFKEIGIYDELFYDFMRLKQECFNLMSFYDYNIISLGSGCMPKLWSVKWGLAPTQARSTDKACGRLPFDLGVHHPHITLKLLKTNFENYTNNVIRKLPSGEYIYYNEEMDIYFNHELPLIKDEKSLIDFNSKILPKRVNDFYNKVNNTNNLFLISIKNNCTHKTLMALRNLLSDKYNSDLLVLNSGEPLDESSLNIINYAYPLSTHTHTHTQRPYIWYKFVDWFTDEGVAFEYSVIKLIMDFIYKNFSELDEPVIPRETSLEKLFLHIANYQLSCGDRERAILFLEKAKNEGCQYPDLHSFIQNSLKTS